MRGHTRGSPKPAAGTTRLPWSSARAFCALVYLRLADFQPSFFGEVGAGEGDVERDAVAHVVTRDESGLAVRSADLEGR